LNTATVGTWLIKQQLARQLAGKLEVKCAPQVRATGLGLDSAAIGIRNSLSSLHYGDEIE
jgi:hypothetical protein